MPYYYAFCAELSSYLNTPEIGFEVKKYRKATFPIVVINAIYFNAPSGNSEINSGKAKISKTKDSKFSQNVLD